MRICSVSDVHIKRDDDEATRLFLRFLEHAKSFDHVVLLGDIFDLMVGGNHDWIKKFPTTFKKLHELSTQTNIHYIEGNHDFHLKRLFDHASLQKIQHYAGDLRLIQNGQHLCFSHGDDVEIENPSYVTYKKIIKQRFVEMLASELVPVSIIEKIGKKASSESAKHSRRYEESAEQIEKIQQKFRRSAVDYYQRHQNFDLLVCGHSHVKDLWSPDQNFTYANNGYFQKEKTFTAIEDGKVRFIDLV